MKKSTRENLENILLLILSILFAISGGLLKNMFEQEAPFEWIVVTIVAVGVFFALALLLISKIRKHE